MGAGMRSRHKGSGRLCVSILGDGDYLITSNALWTASKYQIPLLIVVLNNRSYYNDEEHQERMARWRQRPVENKGIGIRIEDPAPDLAAIARALSVDGFGPITEPGQLGATRDRRSLRRVRTSKLLSAFSLKQQKQHRLEFWPIASCRITGTWSYGRCEMEKWKSLSNG
jgi:TPP-dependent trihydroxycyclohexane-1,2-dione (THcHDO) dehydratase